MQLTPLHPNATYFGHVRFATTTALVDAAHVRGLVRGD